MRYGFKSMCMAASALALIACGGGDSSSSSAPITGGTTTTPVTTAPKATALETSAEAQGFLTIAGMGPNESQAETMAGKDAADWLNSQFNRPATYTLPIMQSLFTEQGDTRRRHSDVLWDTMITADDELRQRMMFALSQIFVTSDNGTFNRGFMTANYTDILTKHAFGNYRDLLEDVTYSPAMARYLTYYRNRKGDPRTGRMPDENYAREVLQLFSIGLVELNMDGTPKLGSDGQPIETYDNDDILGLARVFTGFYANGTSTRTADRTPDWEWTRLKVFDEQHSELEKVFLGTTIPANTPGDESVKIALDTIANHPNVAPFISRQLIQRFTASSPAPDYIERVARVFEAGTFTAPDGKTFGTGERGDLKATLAAVLLDPSVHDGVQAPNEGKVREPILKFIHLMRAFNAQPINTDIEYSLGDTSDPSTRLGQHILRSPSVFNFYRPGYVAPGTVSGDAGLTAPEFQIMGSSSSSGYFNFLTRFMADKADDSGADASFVPNYTKELPLADDPAALMNHLDMLMTGGTMTETTRTDIIDAITGIPIDENSPEFGRMKRVQLAVMMSAMSGAFAVAN